MVDPLAYSDYFRRAMSWRDGDPYPYQDRLALDTPWPDLLDVPTGLGKTAAVTLAWAWKRGWRFGGRRGEIDPDTPRRLVWCLPMRVLVEQTVSNIQDWLSNLDICAPLGSERVSVHLLMGGEEDLGSWVQYPEDDMILVGTQDMLLSRALMRGYGMSRYRWPMDFALLHNDALWVFDEVQLMGPALATSAQLEGMRRAVETSRPTRSLWVSATLHRDWLRTVDLREHADALQTVQLSDQDRAQSTVTTRLSATKELNQAQTQLNAQNCKNKATAYIAALADEVAESHQAGTQTLVILNRVERAQRLFSALQERLPDVDRLLLHARFRPRERKLIEKQLGGTPGSSARIIVATQAVEAGVDISSRTLITELAPWSSLVQRFGRCNRAGEHTHAEIRWVDIADDSGEAAPYTDEELSTARRNLVTLSSASAEALPKVDGQPAFCQVLRRRDLMELFNTDPDLSGFDVDVAPYIRDSGTAQAQVFWRDFDPRPTEDISPARDEMCPVGLGQLAEYLNKKGREAWVWDHLGESWQSIDKSRLRPGLVVLLRAADGGYLADQGFESDSKKAVPAVVPAGGKSQERYSGDPKTQIGRYVELSEHLEDVATHADQLASALALPRHDCDVLVNAGCWHDVGKAHEAFQRGIVGDDVQAGHTLWAKSARSGRPNYFVVDDKGDQYPRRGFRHELASMLAWLEHAEPSADRDLIAYLIAAHHGKVRLRLRALPIENEPPDGETLYARGVWQGDRLPALVFNGRTIPETSLRLDLMRLGQGPQGPSWTERTRRLLEVYGPFRLAWLETLVRIADWRASAQEAKQ